MTQPTPTTCQICGRAIKAKTGRIAHHGYKRPGHGWQTASCMGAGHAPYEQGHTALDFAIERMPVQITETEEALAEFIANPPAELVTRRDAYGRTTRTEARPEGFNPADLGVQGDRPGTYESTFDSSVHARRTTIRDMKVFLEYCRERRAAWKAPS